MKIRVAAWAAAVLTIVLIAWFWQGIDDSAANFLSRPSTVLADLKNWVVDPPLRSDIFVTVGEAGLGLVIASLAAIVLASVLAANRTVAEVAEPFISATNAIPKLALAPLFILVFGIAFTSKVAFVAVSVFFIPFYALFHALRTVDPTVLDHVRILGANRLHVSRDVYVPAVIGSVTASLRSAVAFALVTAVIAELIAANAGIGYSISAAAQNGAPGRLISGILLIGIIGFILDRVLLLVERRFSRWRVAAAHADGVAG